MPDQEKKAAPLPTTFTFTPTQTDHLLGMLRGAAEMERQSFGGIKCEDCQGILDTLEETILAARTTKPPKREREFQLAPGVEVVELGSTVGFHVGLPFEEVLKLHAFLQLPFWAFRRRRKLRASLQLTEQEFREFEQMVRERDPTHGFETEGDG